MGDMISKDAAVAVAEGYWESIGGGMPEGPSGEAILETIDAISAGLRALEPAPDLAELAEALRWYGEQSRLARLIHSEGDAGRHAISADGGKRAAAALAKIKEPQT